MRVGVCLGEGVGAWVRGLACAGAGARACGRVGIGARRRVRVGARARGAKLLILPGKFNC